MTHLIEDLHRRLVGVMLVARNLDYLSQVQSTISYSRKLAALGRLSAGVAHEVKNPLNAMMIHLELLKQQLARGGAVRRAVPRWIWRRRREHLSIIGGEIHRLDEVVQGFLKFTRPEELRLRDRCRWRRCSTRWCRWSRPRRRNTGLRSTSSARATGSTSAPMPAMLQQSFLNLALNACQAMPEGGRLRIAVRHARGGRVEVVFEDTGVGIPPEHLERIFDLYFTTKERGSGIGLSMVYRTVQLHDGDIEVQSTPGRGTTFRLLLPQA